MRAMSGRRNSSSATRSIRTRPNPASRSAGYEADRSAVAPSCGADRCIDGAIWISKLIFGRESRIDWPIRYADIAPWYDRVEDFIGISGEPLAFRNYPTAGSFRRWS